MIPQNIFRAYDIRGLYPTELNAGAAEAIGKGFGTFLIRTDSRFRGNDKVRPRVVVGCDVRQSSPELHLSFMHALASTGCKVTDIGLSPTPLLYFANTTGHFDGGCAITASHNPKEYNGFKLIRDKGHAIFGDEIQEIYKIIQKGDFEKGKGVVEEKDGYADEYLSALASFLFAKRPLKIVIDTGNGVAGGLYPLVLKKLGHEVIPLYTEFDGNFPNHEPDPIVEKNLTVLKAKVLEVKADLGLAFDGDGDRVSMMTEKGEFVTADRLLLLLTQDVLSRHPGANLVYTVSNSQLLFDLAKKWGGKPVMCKVGHSYVERAMQENQAMLGGEQSGHFFLPEDYYSFDDALVAACRVLKIMSESGKRASELLNQFPKIYSEPELRPKCPDDKKFQILDKIKLFFGKQFPHSTIDGIRLEFGEGAWAGIRVSNTSPCLSVILEAGTLKKLDEIKKTIFGHLKTYPEIQWK